LKDVSLVSELSYIAEETEAMAISGDAFDIKEVTALAPRGTERMGLNASAVDFDVDDNLSEHSGGTNASELMVDDSKGSGRDTKPSTGRRLSHRALKRSPSGSYNIKEMLDRWEEPFSKGDKVRSLLGSTADMRTEFPPLSNTIVA